MNTTRYVIIETVDQLDALPEESVVLSADGWALQRRDIGWWWAGGHATGAWTAHDIFAMDEDEGWLPLRLLHRGDTA